VAPAFRRGISTRGDYVASNWVALTSDLGL